MQRPIKPSSRVALIDIGHRMSHFWHNTNTRSDEGIMSMQIAVEINAMSLSLPMALISVIKLGVCKLP